jgi:ribosome-associated toxin RatA of RatAB toxin-antitoxin module
VKHLLLVLLFATTTFASESRFAIDPNANLADLARTHQPKVTLAQNGLHYMSDASAVLAADPDRLFSVSVDFERYAAIRMPNVRESHVVAHGPPSGPETLVAWTHMSVYGQASRHYMTVTLHRQLSGASGRRASGTEWELTRRMPGSPYPEAPQFKTLNGSWYIEPLASGGVYVRYFLSAEIDTKVPPFLVDQIMRQQFTDGITQVILTLAREASVRHD